MARFFNTTGPCRPDQDFMLPTGQPWLANALADQLVEKLVILDRRQAAGPLEECCEISEVEHEEGRIRLLRL